MNFESKTRGLSVKPPTSLAEINTSVEPSTFVVWLLHVKAFVYFLLGMATKRTAIAHSRFLADRRLHRFCLTTQPVVVWQRKLKSIERDSVLACFWIWICLTWSDFEPRSWIGNWRGRFFSSGNWNFKIKLAPCTWTEQPYSWWYWFVFRYKDLTLAFNCLLYLWSGRFIDFVLASYFPIYLSLSYVP